jgi:hypothetical protein
VALKKVPGVESVDVSLNKGLATVKLKPENTATVTQFWQVIHENGYTPKATTVSVRGDLAGAQGRIQLEVAGTKNVLYLVADPAHPAAFSELSKKLGLTVSVRGVMTPGKDLKAAVPLQVQEMR